MSKKKFNGEIDEFGFPFLYVDLINPVTNQSIIRKKAIIDTGAAYTHIKQSIINEICLTSVKEIDTKHLSDGNLKTGIFNLNIMFNNSVIVPNIKTRLLHSNEYPSDLVIGLDILKHCDFYYDSANKLFSFHLLPLVLENQKD